MGLALEQRERRGRWILRSLTGLATLSLLCSGGQQEITPIAGHPAPLPQGRGLESPPAEPPAAPGGESPCTGAGELADLYLASGEFHHSAVDLRIPGRGLDFVWARKYRSRHGPNSAIGNGWDFSYNLRIAAAGQHVRLFDGNTRSDLYLRRPDDTYVAAEFFREGEFNPDSTFTLTFADSGRWNFRALDGSPAAGKIQSIVDRNGNTLSFAYDVLGRLITITDTLGRNVTVAYNASSLIQSVTDFTGRQVLYTYYVNGDAGGSAGDLRSARSPVVVGTPNGNNFPAGKTTLYTYSKGFADERLNHNLLTIRDPKGQIWLRNAYTAVEMPKSFRFDRVATQTRGNLTDTIEVTYALLRPSMADPSSAIVRAIVNDRMGNVSEYSYDARNRLVLRREYTGRANPALPTTATANRPVSPLRPDDPTYFETRWEYNADALVTRVVHPNGNETRKVYELELDPAAPARSRGNLRELRRLPGTHVPAGDQPELVELFEYDPGFGGCCGTNFVSEHTDARGYTTTHTYDANGNRLHTQHRIPSIVEDWEYNGFGQVTAHVLPENDSGSRRRDEYTYYTPLDGAQNGYLKDEIVDANGFALTTTHEYDARGNVVRTIDPRGHDTLYTVNALNQVLRELSREVTDGSGIRYETLSFYDANDNLVRIDVENRDADGVLQANAYFTTSLVYEILNNVVLETREVDSVESVVSEYAYDANRNLRLERKGEAVNGNQPSNTVTTLYDERNLVWQVIEAEGASEQATVQTDYDPNGNVRAERDGLEDAPAHVTLYSYDAYDRLVLATDPVGNVRTYHYDPNGNEGGNASETPPSANPFGLRIDGELLDLDGSASNLRLAEVQYAYDAMDRRIVEERRFFDPLTQLPIDDGQATTTTDWTPSSQVLSVTDDNGNTSTTSYDTANRRLLDTDAAGNTTAYDYDANSNLILVVEEHLSDLGNPAETFQTNYAYDNLDRLILRSDDLALTTEYRYDSRDNRTVELDDRGNETRYVYDGLDRLIRTERDLTNDGTGGGTLIDTIVVTQSWDDSSRLLESTDDNGNTTSYSYDACDRRIQTDHPDCTSSGALWDAHGAQVVRVDANGTLIDTLYDSLERPIQHDVTPGPGVLGTTSQTYQYDGLSRLVRAQDEDSLVTRRYDSLANPIVEEQQVLPGPVRSVTSTFDGVGNRLSLTYPGGRVITQFPDALERPSVVLDDTPPGPSALIALYAYVGPRRVEAREYGNDTLLEIDYDAIQRPILTRHSVASTGTPFDERVHGWLCAHAKLATTDVTTTETVTYEYDSVDRLIRSSSSTSGCPTSYFLDGHGNRQFVSGCVDPGSYWRDATLCEPADFQMDQYTYTPTGDRQYDGNGNLVGKPSSFEAFGYDYRNQLVQFSGSGQFIQYRYDALGRRIEIDPSFGFPGAITRHYYAGALEIEEQDGWGTPLATYVWGEGPGEILQMERAGQRYFYHGDDQGSVMTITDAFCTPVERARYGDFGHVSLFSGFGFPISQTQIGNHWLFSGLRYDAALGLYSSLDPRAGRHFRATGSEIGLSSGHRFTFAQDNPQSLALVSLTIVQDPPKPKPVKPQDTVPIEIVSLSLTSANPVVQQEPKDPPVEDGWSIHFPVVPFGGKCGRAEMDASFKFQSPCYTDDERAADPWWYTNEDMFMDFDLSSKLYNMCTKRCSNMGGCPEKTACKLDSITGRPSRSFKSEPCPPPGGGRRRVLRTEGKLVCKCKCE